MFPSATITEVMSCHIGETAVRQSDGIRQRENVGAFLAASRGGIFQALLAALDPDVPFRHDITAVPAGATREVRGAQEVAAQFAGRARLAEPGLIDGQVA